MILPQIAEEGPSELGAGHRRGWSNRLRDCVGELDRWWHESGAEAVDAIAGRRENTAASIAHELGAVITYDQRTTAEGAPLGLHGLASPLGAGCTGEDAEPPDSHDVS